ncbi:MAG: hypothetical protein ACTSQY_02730 [Candidatus Odinarchaeia archaeon]
MKKICSKCKNEYPLTSEYWHINRSKMDGFCHYCKKCRKKRQQQGYQKRQNVPFEQSTLLWTLQNRYNCIVARCTDSKCKSYKYYGAKGIGNSFNSFQDFFNYITQDLNITTYEQIKDKEIHRIDNSLGYQPNNITFLTIPEHHQIHAQLRKCKNTQS